MAETQEESQPVQEEEKQSVNAIDEASKILAEIKQQNEILRSNVVALQEMKATEMVSGQSNAGQTPKEKSADELEKEGAKKMLEGTGFENLEM